MNRIHQYSLILAIATAALSAWSADVPPSPPATNQVVNPANDTAPPPAPAAAPKGDEAAPSTQADTNALPPVPEGFLRLNFRGAPLNLVLDYLSDAAGFVINKETDVRGSVEVWSKEPVRKDEAVEILNSVLKKNGYAVIRNGRILTIVALDSAKTADLPVEVGSNADEVDRSDEVVTQIIQVRHANATQLMNNLQVLLPTSANLSVNESANTLILVATKTDIRRMLRIVTALDTSIASVASIKVFPLRYADARQLATVVQQLFAPQTSAQAGGGRGQFFNMFRGGGPFGGGGPGGMGGQQGGGAGTGGNAAGSRVVAAADEYSNSLIVSAAADLMATISDMVEQVDQPVSDITEVRVFKLQNADPTELADQFTQLFPNDSRSSDNQNGGRFRFFGGGRFGGAGNQSSSTDRTRKKTQVLAVADPRTRSLIVTAAAEMMPQIAEMVTQLDSNDARKERVAVFDLQNANPQDVYEVMQDLFNRNNTMRANNNSQNSLLGRNNPLTQRSTQQQQQSSSMMNNRFGSGARTGSSF